MSSLSPAPQHAPDRQGIRPGVPETLPTNGIDVPTTSAGGGSTQAPAPVSTSAATPAATPRRTHRARRAVSGQPLEVIRGAVVERLFGSGRPGPWAAGLLQTEGRRVAFSGETGWDRSVLEALAQDRRLVAALGKRAPRRDGGGEEFQVRALHVAEPPDSYGLYRLLTEGTPQDHWGRIDPAVARSLLERHGPSGLADLMLFAVRDAGRLAPLTEAQVDAVRTRWIDRFRASPGLYANLLKYGIAFEIAEKAVSQLGPHGLAAIHANPYALCALEGVRFEDVDDAMRRADFRFVPPDDARRLAAAVQAAVQQLEVQGHAHHSEAELRWRVRRLVSPTAKASPVVDALVDQALRGAVRSGALVVEGGAWYSADAWACQQSLATSVSGLMTASSRCASRVPTMADCRALFTAHGLDLNEEQLATTQLLRGQLSIVTGGAGTGKSYTQAALALLGRHAGIRMTFAASTGMAAKNLSHGLGGTVQADTLHLLWEQSKHRSPVDPSVLYDTDVLVVDEASMLTDDIGAWMCAEAAKTGTAVVLVGDPEQLEPVGRGQFFENLLQVEGQDGKRVPTVRLKVPKRADKQSLITWNAARMRQGKPPIYAKNHALSWTPALIAEAAADLEVEPTRVDPTQFVANSHFVDVHARPLEKPLPASLQHPRAPELPRSTLRVYEVVEGLRRHYAREDVCIMSAVHDGPLGTKSVNVALQHLYNPDGEPVGLSDGHRLPLRVGDPIVNKKARAKRKPVVGEEAVELVNGDEGVITGVLPNGRRGFRARFGEHEVELDAREAREHHLRYCISIHGAQGQTTKAAVFVAGEEHRGLVRRRAAVTAVTRPRFQMVTVGVEDVVRAAVAEPPVPRRTGLTAAIARTYDAKRLDPALRYGARLVAEPPAPDTDHAGPPRLRLRPLAGTTAPTRDTMAQATLAIPASATAVTPAAAAPPAPGANEGLRASGPRATPVVRQAPVTQDGPDDQKAREPKRSRKASRSRRTR